MENEKDEKRIRVVVKEVGMPPEERMIPNTLESLQVRVGGLIEREPIFQTIRAWMCGAPFVSPHTITLLRNH